MKFITTIKRKSRSSKSSIGEGSAACPNSEELSGALSSDFDMMCSDHDNTPTHKEFIKKNGSVYPYNELFKTKKEFHVKWLLSDTEQSGKHIKKGRRESLNRIAPIHSSTFDDEAATIHIATNNGIHNPKKKNNIEVGINKVFLTLANTIDNETVQHLILTKQVYPVPPTMERILDAMRQYETDQDRLWYKQVLDYFFGCLKFEVKHDDKKLAKDSIEYRVCGVIRRELRHSASDQTDFNRLVNDWSLWFDLQYKINDNYFYLAEESVQYISSESFMSSTHRRIPKDWDN